MVHQSFLKKIAIPFTVVSTSVLTFCSKAAYAETLLDRGDVRKGVFSKSQIAERGGSIEEIKTFFTGAIDKFNEITIWMNNLHEHIAEFSVDLITYIYEILTKIVLHTPLFIFNNSYLKNTSLTFALVSITLVTILTIFESLMQISKKKHTKFSDIMKRYPVAIAITGFAPFLFENGFRAINKLSSIITTIGGSLNRDGMLIMETPTSGLDVLIMLIFDGMLIGLLIPVFLQNGRRWFDLLTLAVISPLAMTAYCFDRHRHLFTSWLEQIKKLSTVQLVYSVFIMLMGVFIYGTRYMTGGFELLIFKMLIVLGSLYRLSNPPAFVKRMTDQGDDVMDVGKNAFSTIKGVYDTVTLKKFKNVVSKGKKVKSLRLKHGKRNVGDLL